MGFRMIFTLNQKFRKFILVLAMSFVMVGFPTNVVSDPLRVAIILGGTVGEFGWSHSHVQPIPAIKETFGDQIEDVIVYEQEDLNIENTEIAMRSMLNSGVRLFFIASYQLTDITLQLAAEYPNAIFEIATGTQTAKNVGNYSPRFYEGRYSAGVVSGTISSSGKIGYIAPYPIPEVARGINAVMLGARSINPNARVLTAWTNAWSDNTAEAKAATELFDRGVEVIVPHTAGNLALAIAETRGVFAFGKASDMSTYGPNAQLAAISNDWTQFYITRIQEVLDGTWESSSVWSGPIGPTARLTHFNENQVGEKQIEMIRTLEKDMKLGKFHPFSGPIYNTHGELMVEESKRLSDDQLREMNWFVQGVEQL